MQHSLCFAGNMYELFSLRHALLMAAFAFCCNTDILSQTTVEKPITEDSMSFKGLFSVGYGFGTMDMKQLNQTLIESNLNTVEEQMSFINANAKIPIGKKFLLGADIKGLFLNTSSTLDSIGIYQVTANSYDFGMNVGYLLFQSSSLLILPSIGLSSGSNSTYVTLRSKSSEEPHPTVKDELLNSSVDNIQESVGYLNLSFQMEAYLKLFSIGGNETSVHTIHDKSVNVQHTSDIWLCGFVTYNQILVSPSFEKGVTLYDNFSHGSIGYKPSAVNYGLRLMFTSSLRFFLAP